MCRSQTVAVLAALSPVMDRQLTPERGTGDKLGIGSPVGGGERGANWKRAFFLAIETALVQKPDSDVALTA